MTKPIPDLPRGLNEETPIDICGDLKNLIVQIDPLARHSDLYALCGIAEAVVAAVNTTRASPVRAATPPFLLSIDEGSGL
jgi:hypothetical protein